MHTTNSSWGKFALAFVLFFSPIELFAIDSESDREALVSAKSKKFYRSNSVRKYLSIGGDYTSTGTSKKYEFDTRYLYQSKSQIHQFDFQKEDKYSNLGSSKGKTYLVKKSELYDGAISSKFTLGETENYFAGYHRTIYDDMSKYYRDQRTAAGFGRMFFKRKLELDCSIGYHDVKVYGYKMSVIPSYRANIKLDKKFSINSRGYFYIDHESMDNEIKTSLIYRFSKNTSFEIRYTFEQRRYEDDTKKLMQINSVYKKLTMGLVFDLN